jgi:hypothetical protein
MRANLTNVQWLTIAELADHWAPEIEVPRDVVVRELRLGLYKWENAKHNPEFVCGRPLKQRPPEEDLPSVDDARVDRVFMMAFCEKQRWPLPQFWFQRRQPARSFPGRPSIMGAIVQELRRRVEDRQLEDTLAMESRVLEAWAREHHPGLQTPTAKAIENGIRNEYRVLRRTIADASTH